MSIEASVNIKQFRERKEACLELHHTFVEVVVFQGSKQLRHSYVVLSKLEIYQVFEVIFYRTRTVRCLVPRNSSSKLELLSYEGVNRWQYARTPQSGWFGRCMCSPASRLVFNMHAHTQTHSSACTS